MNLYVDIECYTTTRMYIIARILAKTLCKISLNSYSYTLHCSAEAKITKKSKQHSAVVNAQYQTLMVDHICTIATLILERHQVPSLLHP